MNKDHFIIKHKLHHLLFWALVFVIWYVLRADDYSSPAKAAWVTWIKVSELALMIYITNGLLIPRLLYKKQYVLFALIFIVMIFTSSVLKMYGIGQLINNPALIHWERDLKGSLYNNILPHFFLVIAGAAGKLLLDFGTLQQRMAETAKEKAEAELNFLKSQINPHFIFNSLNSVYFLIQKENTVARDALHKFSEMLRYQLYEVNDAKIPVEKEIRYLKDYMDLQQLRKDENYSVTFECSPEVRGFFLEPLLLIPFLENACKHISHHKGMENFVRVRLAYQKNVFVFEAENSKEDQPSTEKSGGIGLVNVRRRLELLYPGKHELSIVDREGLFRVQLKLQI